MEITKLKINNDLLKELHAFFKNPQGERIVNIFTELFLIKPSYNESPLKTAYNEGFKGFVLFLRDILIEDINLEEDTSKSIVKDLFGEDND